MENTNLQNTSNLLDSVSQLVYLPDAVLPGTVALAGSNIRLRKQGLERRINDEQILIGFQRSPIQRPLMRQSCLTKNRLDTADFLESGQDLVNRDRRDLDRNVLPGL